ncbi:conserved membrane hypothetical protein [metagenome]
MRNFLIVFLITEQTKVVIKITDSLLDTIDILLDLQVGDTSRLEHIKKMILENKQLYVSDQQYVQSLAITYNIGDQKKIDNPEQAKLINCRTCSSSIPESANYCTLCGSRQNRDNQSIVKKFNPLTFIPKPKSYQYLAIIGALTAMIPVLFIVARLDPLLAAIEFDTGRDLSEIAGLFIALGIISSTLSIFAVIVTFVIKNPKKVGRVLFFMAFGILASSVLIGVVGVVFILISSKNAYKKRHY